VATKDVSNYDLVVKELFERDHPSLLDELAGGVAVRQILNSELAITLARRADLVFLLEDESILHLEFQSRNDNEMPYRAGIYCLLLAQKYRRRVRQAVIYLGQAKMKMENFLDMGQTKVAYSLIDIRELDARALMASGNPGDLALATLASGGPEQVVEIWKRAARLKGSARQRALSRIGLLSGLRRLDEGLIMELQAMATTTDPIYKNAFVRYFFREAQAKMLRRQLKTKFRTVPKWANERLDAATAEQIERWSTKILRAETLEGVLGKK
jgi:hypothetical protein